MSDPVLETLFEIKGDVGEMKASLRALNAWMEQHASEDREAHERIAELELNSATRRGRASVWHLMATGAGATIGFLADHAITFFGGKP